MGNKKMKQMCTVTTERAKQLLKVSSKRVWRERLEAIGVFNPKTSLTREHLKALLGLHLFLQVGHGSHSKTQFSKIYELGRLDEQMRTLDIDLDEEFRRWHQKNQPFAV